jgi:hypothetical protein
VIGDFNGDDIEDLAAASFGTAGERVSVWLGKGDAGFRGPMEVDVPAASIVAGDFNGDDVDDLAYGTGTDHAGLLLAAGDGSFTVGPTVDLPAQSFAIDGLVVGDFDADGNEDLAAALPRRGAVSIRFGDGAGKLTGGPEVGVKGAPFGLAAGDLDADGDDDITSAGGAAVSVLLSDGKRNFTAAADVPVKPGAIDMVLADLDRDGNDDIVTASQDQPGQSLSVRLGRGATVLDGNLLVNGGFEQGAPERKLGPGSDIPGWVRSGQSTVHPYGFRSSAFNPTILDSPRYASGGTAFFSGGRSTDSNGVTGASQTVNVAERATAVDEGRVTANLSAYLGGARNVSDAMEVRADFVGPDGALLGAVKVGPLTPGDRKNQTRLLRRAASAPGPAGTRQIRVTLTSTDADKTYSSATADNVKLTVAERPATPQPGGGEPQPTAVFGTDTAVTIKRVGSKRRLRVRVTNANAFAVSGTVRGRGVARKPLQIAANGKQTVRLRVTKSLKRKLTRKRKVVLRLRAVVRDPAGNTRTVRRTTTVRKGRS